MGALVLLLAFQNETHSGMVVRLGPPRGGLGAGLWGGGNVWNFIHLPGRSHRGAGDGACFVADRKWIQPRCPVSTAINENRTIERAKTKNDGIHQKRPVVGH